MIDSLLLTLAALGSVFGWAFFSFWSSIPAGIALGLAPLLVALTATVSYGSGAALVVLAGAPLRTRIQRRMASRVLVDGASAEAAPEPSRVVRMVENAWRRYGLIGLALLAPMTVGAQIGAVIGLGLGVNPLRLVVAMTLGAGLWALLIAAAVALGLLAVA